LNKVRQIWNSGGSALAAWLQLHGVLHAETMANCGYDAVVIDLQHSTTTFDQAVSMMVAIEKAGVEPIVRLKWNEPSDIMKLIDAGAYGVIAPMIDCAEDARKFADALHYPPLGKRSYGPRRPVLKYGKDYVDKASDSVVSMAMIETSEGLKNAAEILEVNGIDGIFIGPTDLSLALGVAPKPDPTEPIVLESITKLRELAHAHGKVVGIFTGSGEGAKQRLSEGFDFVSATPDLAMLTTAARATVATARQGLKSNV
jgi:4-hydroxy-2-oxoheptanedioate aldolase